MAARQLVRALMGLAAWGVVAGVLPTVAACNALVGNGDIQLADDAGPDDATTGLPDRVDATSASDVAEGAPQEATAATTDAPQEAAPIPDAGCSPDMKYCSGACRALDDPGYGCSAAACAPCELANANSSCGPPDGGDASSPVCTPLCKANHGDCNGDPLDGCEVDTSADLYNSGACGHDCTNLPHVAGNVSCVAGVCSFGQSSCAPGYGICSTNLDDGCDTLISEPAHCGGCSTSCSNPGFPYCSPTGNAAQPFACTSGCGAGLSLCGTSCVNEANDPNHCGGCAAQCPTVAGGTPTCAAGGTCGFSCNANDHLCGTGAAGSCAANNDPTSCGVGAACGPCGAPANAAATCSGGTTCGYACNANAHACAGACPLDADPNNCGSRCGTNCPAPGAGTGTGFASCNVNACSITCNAGSTLCGGACVNTQADPVNCGGCGTTCAAGQACSGGNCVCNAASCPSGCCDGNGHCQARACGTGGATCVPGCPATVPEVPSLALWLVGDNYVASAGKWLDQSGAHADALCSGTCPLAVTGGGPNGHRVVSFGGSSFFTLTDPGRQFLSPTQSWTLFVVASPDPAAVSGAQILAFSSGGDAIELQRSGGSGDLAFTLLPGSSANQLVASGAWGGAWEAIAANVDPTSASLTAATATASGALGTPAAVDYAASFLGTDPSQTANYTGQIAEVVVFTGDLSATSMTAIETYLASRYGSLQ